MRLGQLARKLAVRPSDIVELLAGKAIATEEGTNTKLTDEHVKLIVAQFAPDQLASILNTEPTLQPIESAQVIAEPVVVEEPVTAVVSEIAPDPSPEIQEDKKEEIEQIEVIKAPKVELSGLKVLGKIELPQPKKKEVPAENAEKTESNSEVVKPAPSERRPQRENRKNFTQNKDRRDFRPRKNPIALQREREAQEAEEKKKEEAKQKKEQRTNYYLERVKLAAPTKPARIYDEAVLEMKDHQAKAKKQPTTWLGKFWKWYTS